MCEATTSSSSWLNPSNRRLPPSELSRAMLLGPPRSHFRPEPKRDPADSSRTEIVPGVRGRAYRLTPAMDTSEARGASGSLPIVTGKKLMLFAGRANPELAAKIAHKLAIELGHITLKTFSAGEGYCRTDR